MGQRLPCRRRSLAGVLALSLAGTGFWAVVAAAQEAERQEEPVQPREAPADTSFTDLLAEEAEADAAASEEEAAETLLPFRRRSQPLQGLPAAMAALMMGSQPGGPVLTAVLALPLALTPPPAADPAAATASDPADPAAAADPAADAAAAAAEAAAADKALVALFVEIDGASLLGPTPGEAAEIELFAYALQAPGGGVAGFLSQRLAVDLAELGELIFAGGVKMVGHLELPPGDYVLRVLVHERSSQRYGLRHVALSVPSGVSVSQPLAPDPLAPWLFVVESPHGAYGRVDYAALLQRAGTPPPSALPVIAGDRAELDVLLATGGAAEAPIDLEARFLDVAEEPAATAPVEILARRPTELPGFERLRIGVPLDALATGSYYLTLAGAAGGQALASPELPLVVLRQAQQAAVWTEIERQRSGAAPPAQLELGAGSPSRRRDPRGERVARAIERAYADVLARLAGGDREGAVDQLADIERQVAESQATQRPFEILAASQLAVVDRLAAADAESLLPVALLHAEAYRRQREAKSFGLASHSRVMALAAAERYAASSQIEEAARLASHVLAMIGDELQRGQVRKTAREVLERAVALDTENRFALVSLAAGLEKTADYQGAADQLRRLVVIDPKAPEGRLRLAINLLRLGQGTEGIPILRRLIDEDNPEWVLTIAYETLAAELLRERSQPADLVRQNQAAGLLRQAVGRLPDQPRLALQLAYALERAGRPGEAAAVIARLSGRPDAGASPRHFYHQWPDGDRDEIERQLVQAGFVRLPRLTSALAALPAGTS